MTSRCSRRRRYTTCKKKRSCKWVKRGKSHKGYCKKRTKRSRGSKRSRGTKHSRQRGGQLDDMVIARANYAPTKLDKHPSGPKDEIDDWFGRSML